MGDDDQVLTSESRDGSVVTVDPTTDPRWDDLLRRTRADIFHSPAWLRVLNDTYGVRAEARILTSGGVPTAGLVYVPMDGSLDPRTTSLPFSDFCDPLVSSEAEWLLLVDGLLDPDRRYSTRCLHSEVPRSDPRLTEVGRARWHGVDLDRPLDEMWEQLEPSARRSIRKARTQGVEIRVGTSIEDVRAMFELHLGVRKNKYRLLAQPWRFFENIWSHLFEEGLGHLLLAIHDGRLVGGVMFLEWDGTLYYKFNASSADDLSVRPNDLMIWEAISGAAEKGMRVLDFGVSDWDQEGLVRFKRKYATQEKTVHFLQHMLADSPTAREQELRVLLPRLTELFTDPGVPDSVTERAGDLLYSLFS